MRFPARLLLPGPQDPRFAQLSLRLINLLKPLQDERGFARGMRLMRRIKLPAHESPAADERDPLSRDRKSIVAGVPITLDLPSKSAGTIFCRQLAPRAGGIGRHTRTL